jgi:hypothetical protein
MSNESVPTLKRGNIKKETLKRRKKRLETP